MWCAGRIVILSCVCVLGVLSATRNDQRLRTRVAPAKNYPGDNPIESHPKTPTPNFSGLFTGNRRNFPHTEDLCKGILTYPVNLPIDASIAKYGHLNFTGFNNAYDTQLAYLDDYLELVFKHKKEIFVSDAGLDGRYYLHKIRIFTPSQHTITGVSYSLEIQYVFVNTQYADYEVASTHPDGLAIVVVLAVIGNDPHPAFQEILDTVGKFTKEKQAQALEHPFSPESLLPEELCTFFRYRGKLSSETCEEIATWTILTDPLHITKEQLIDLLDFVDPETDEYGFIKNEQTSKKEGKSTSITDIDESEPENHGIITVQPIMFCRNQILDRSGFPWYIFHRT